MTRLYLAGPMTGYPTHNFPAFAEAAARLRAAGHEVHSPAEVDLANGFDPESATMTREEYGKVLMEDLRVIHEWADGVALLPGWERSRGARAEHALARALGKEVWAVRVWLHECLT